MAYRLDSNLEDAIYDWAVDCLGSEVTVIWDKPEDTRPNKPYCTLNISTPPYNIGDRGENWYKSLDTWEYYFTKIFTLSVNIYGDEYVSQLMTNVYNGTFLETKLQTLRAEGMAIHNRIGPNDLSIPLETEFEFRNQLDIMISYGVLVSDIPGEISKVSVNGRDIEI